MAESSSFAIAMNMLTSPTSAFATLKERPRVWLPLLLMLGGYVAIYYLYMYSVDLGWWMEQQLAPNTDMPAQARQDAIAAAANGSPGFYGTITAAATVIALLIFLFFVSLYYTVISFVSGDGVKLGQWWCFAWWCTLPALFGIVATIVNLSVTDARFMLQDTINPLSFGNLLGMERTATTPIVARILLSIDIFTVWSLALAAIGYQIFSGKSFVKSALIVLGPLAFVVLTVTAVSAVR